MIQVLIKMLGGTKPQRATDGAAAYDLYAASEDFVFTGKVTKIKLGFALAIPKTHFAYIRPRSGLASLHGIAMAGSGVIDSDYRGEVMMPLISHVTRQHHVSKGERVGQMLILPVPDVSLIETNELPKTERGEGGFGSTGK